MLSPWEFASAIITLTLGIFLGVRPSMSLTSLWATWPVLRELSSGDDSVTVADHCPGQWMLVPSSKLTEPPGKEALKFSRITAYRVMQEPRCVSKSVSRSCSLASSLSRSFVIMQRRKSGYQPEWSAP